MKEIQAELLPVVTQEMFFRGCKKDGRYGAVWRKVRRE